MLFRVLTIIAIAVLAVYYLMKTLAKKKKDGKVERSRIITFLVILMLELAVISATLWWNSNQKKLAYSDELIAQTRYIEAYNILSDLETRYSGGYQDVAERIESIKPYYDIECAISYIQSDDYDQAIIILSDIRDFNDESRFLFDYAVKEYVKEIEQDGD